jgi:hypothetical protein
MCPSEAVQPTAEGQEGPRLLLSRYRLASYSVMRQVQFSTRPFSYEEHLSSRCAYNDDGKYGTACSQGDWLIPLLFVTLTQPSWRRNQYRLRAVCCATLQRKGTVGESILTTGKSQVPAQKIRHDSLVTRHSYSQARVVALKRGLAEHNPFEALVKLKHSQWRLLEGPP